MRLSVQRSKVGGVQDPTACLPFLGQGEGRLLFPAHWAQPGHFVKVMLGLSSSPGPPSVACLGQTEAYQVSQKVPVKGVSDPIWRARVRGGGEVPCSLTRPPSAGPTKPALTLFQPLGQQLSGSHPGPPLSPPQGRSRRPDILLANPFPQ